MLDGDCLHTFRKEKSDSGLNVVLLADFDLLRLPLESLDFLQCDAVKSVSRDFSLQILYHRISNYFVEEGGKREDKKNYFVEEGSKKEGISDYFVERSKR